MQNEQQKHAEDLEQFRSKLLLNNEREIALVTQGLEISKEKYMADHTDKTAIYRLAIGLIADVVLIQKWF